MGQVTADTAPEVPTTRELILGVGRAFGGSLLFVLPILMTMEMWRFGMVLPPMRLVVWVAAALPLLAVLARSLGFRDTAGMTWRDYVADGFVAYGVGVVTTTVALALFDVIPLQRSLSEVVGLVAIESVPASIGAVIARGQFGAATAAGAAGSSSYPGEILVMAVGAGVFAFNVAPTEEVVLIATSAGPVRAVLLALVTMAVMHAVVYLVGFRGEHRSEASAWSVFLGYTVAGYATALMVALALLWMFGRTEGIPLDVVAVETVVLGLPAGVGAAAARLIL